MQQLLTSFELALTRARMEQAGATVRRARRRRR
eukprot:COSAG02_NODE_11836_length_1644_cov_19.200647_3_plen_32_part_01